MPTIEVDYEDLLSLIGRRIPIDELRDKAVMYAKAEVDAIEGTMLKMDIKDANRPDLWSAEGVAREIAGRYGKPGLPQYSVARPSLDVMVDPKVRKVRPYTVCAVVRGLAISGHVLSQMIQLQEKVAETFGKKRREVAIGVYDFSKIKGPIRYTTVKPDGIRFVPLEFTEALTPRQILQQHPKGKEYRHLLDGCAEYPIFIDAAGEVLSMPPIINSNHTGKVTAETRDVFIECSGFSMRFLVPALNVLVAALADRGGSIEGVRVVYPKGHGAGTMVTPDMGPKKHAARLDDINKILGLRLSPAQAVRMLEQARYSARAKGSAIEALYPAYRQDIMHWRDVAEDAIISYGYENVEPVPPKLATTGSESKEEIFCRKVADAMAGMGLQEVLSYMLTSRDSLFRKMNAVEEQAVEIENCMSANWSVFRTWLLPGLMEFLAGNKHVEYPQKVFEIGAAVLLDQSQETGARDARKLAVAVSNTSIGYEDIASILNGLMESLGLKYEMKPKSHPSFIHGRCAAVFAAGKDIGLIGEMHPAALNAWGLEKPVAAFEIGLDEVYSLLSR